MKPSLVVLGFVALASAVPTNPSAQTSSVDVVKRTNGAGPSDPFSHPEKIKGKFAELLKALEHKIKDAIKKIEKLLPSLAGTPTNQTADNSAAAAVDEDWFCNRRTYDLFASYGVNTLRIPIGFWAFMPAIKGDNYYTTGQLYYLSKLSK
ncbi:hypothetical protein BCR34DRAFT_606803 [Clohesyomyces aquaticus]|uniref:Glycoside hydrolase superfamily n=1 Tax=Clohesyomyces aquaticus TaxID=1231657 RepID=A0A1Y1YLE2_9PLEO|nr:hypothetical protein BCR34DRAFT_606803 [Clohesyomyces aquaticus]